MKTLLKWNLILHSSSKYFPLELSISILRCRMQAQLSAHPTTKILEDVKNTCIRNSLHIRYQSENTIVPCRAWNSLEVNGERSQNSVQNAVFFGVSSQAPRIQRFPWASHVPPVPCRLPVRPGNSTGHNNGLGTIEPATCLRRNREQHPISFLRRLTSPTSVTNAGTIFSFRFESKPSACLHITQRSLLWVLRISNVLLVHPWRSLLSLSLPVAFSRGIIQGPRCEQGKTESLCTMLRRRLQFRPLPGAECILDSSNYP